MPYINLLPSSIMNTQPPPTWITAPGRRKSTRRRPLAICLFARTLYQAVLDLKRKKIRMKQKNQGDQAKMHIGPVTMHTGVETRASARLRKSLGLRKKGFTNLPLLVVDKIVSYLDADDLCSAARVNSTWNQAADRLLYRSICYPCLPDLPPAFSPVEKQDSFVVIRNPDKLFETLCKRHEDVKRGLVRDVFLQSKRIFFQEESIGRILHYLSNYVKTSLGLTLCNTIRMPSVKVRVTHVEINDSSVGAVMEAEDFPALEQCLHLPGVQSVTINCLDWRNRWRHRAGEGITHWRQRIGTSAVTELAFRGSLPETNVVLGTLSWIKTLKRLHIPASTDSVDDRRVYLLARDVLHALTVFEEGRLASTIERLSIERSRYDFFATENANSTAYCADLRKFTALKHLHAPLCLFHLTRGPWLVGPIWPEWLPPQLEHMTIYLQMMTPSAFTRERYIGKTVPDALLDWMGKMRAHVQGKDVKLRSLTLYLNGWSELWHKRRFVNKLLELMSTGLKVRVMVEGDFERYLGELVKARYHEFDVLRGNFDRWPCEEVEYRCLWEDHAWEMASPSPF